MVTRRLMFLFAAALLSGAAPPQRIHVIHGLVPLFKTSHPVAAINELDVEVTSWTTVTRPAFAYKGKAFDITGELDLQDPYTYAEVVMDQDRVLEGTREWTVVLRKGARVPLVGGNAKRLELAFLKESMMPVASAVLLGEDKRPVPPEKGAPEVCVLKLMRAARKGNAASWNPGSTEWNVYRAGVTKDGWFPVFARSPSVKAVVHGFGREEDILCNAGTQGGLGMSGTGAGASDGFVDARAAALPKETTLYGSVEQDPPTVTFHREVPGLERIDHSWMVLDVPEGEGGLTVTDMFLKWGDHVETGPLQQHPIGSVQNARGGWPRRAAK